MKINCDGCDGAYYRAVRGEVQQVKSILATTTPHFAINGREYYEVFLVMANDALIFAAATTDPKVVARVSRDLVEMYEVVFEHKRLPARTKMLDGYDRVARMEVQSS